MPPVLTAALSQVGPKATEVFMEHLRGGTSADYLSEWLTRAGHPVSATTLKEARKRLADL